MNPSSGHSVSDILGVEAKETAFETDELPVPYATIEEFANAWREPAPEPEFGISGASPLRRSSHEDLLGEPTVNPNDTLSHGGLDTVFTSVLEGKPALANPFNLSEDHPLYSRGYSRAARHEWLMYRKKNEFFLQIVNRDPSPTSDAADLTEEKYIELFKRFKEKTAHRGRTASEDLAYSELNGKDDESSWSLTDENLIGARLALANEYKRFKEGEIACREFAMRDAKELGRHPDRPVETFAEEYKRFKEYEAREIHAAQELEYLRYGAPNETFIEEYKRHKEKSACWGTNDSEKLAYAELDGKDNGSGWGLTDENLTGARLALAEEYKRFKEDKLIHREICAALEPIHHPTLHNNPSPTDEDLAAERLAFAEEYERYQMEMGCNQDRYSELEPYDTPGGSYDGSWDGSSSYSQSPNYEPTDEKIIAEKLAAAEEHRLFQEQDLFISRHTRQLRAARQPSFSDHSDSDGQDSDNCNAAQAEENRRHREIERFVRKQTFNIEQVLRGGPSGGCTYDERLALAEEFKLYKERIATWETDSSEQLEPQLPDLQVLDSTGNEATSGEVFDCGMVVRKRPSEEALENKEKRARMVLT